MPGRPPDTVRSWATYQFATRALVVITAAASVLIGASYVLGGPARFSSPGLATARLIPGAQDTWGVVFIIAGLTTCVGVGVGWHRRLVMVGIALQGSLFAFLSLALFVAVAHSPTTAASGIIAYGALAAACVVTLVAGHALRSP